MKNITMLILLLTISIVSGQTVEFKKPDYKDIKKQLENKSSRYNNLIGRLMKNDTLLTSQEYINLYYGTALQDNYQPYKHSSVEKELLTYYNKEEFDKKDRKEFIRLAEKSLKEFPIDLRLMNFLAYIHHLDGNKTASKKILKNFDGLIDAILSTGDGKTCETAFHIIYINHEYVILNIFQLENISQSVIGTCDYLAFEKGKYKSDGIYFDVTKLFENSNRD